MNEKVELETVADALGAATEALKEAGLKVEEAELSQFAQNEIELDSKNTLSIMTMIEMLEGSAIAILTILLLSSKGIKFDL